MELKATSAVELPSKYCARKCLPLLLGNRIVSVLEDNRTVVVVNPKNRYNNRLEGHTSPVTALCVSLTGGTLLCSCSQDKVILWDVVSACQDNAAVPPARVVAGIDLGAVEHCALSANNKWLALCQGRQILIITLLFSSNEQSIGNLLTVTEHTVLSCGNSFFHSSIFSPTLSDILVALEENAFKVWKVSSRRLVHQSSSFGVRELLTCSAFSKVSGQLVLGSNTGLAHVFSVATDSSRKVVSVDVARVFCRSINQENECMNLDVETGCMVLAAQLLDCNLHLASPVDLNMFQQDCATLHSILAPGSRLVLCCNVGIAVFDCKTTDCLAQLIFSVQELLPGIKFGLADLILIRCGSMEQLQYVIRDLLRRVYLIRFELKKCTRGGGISGAAVVPIVPVGVDSPLKRVYCNMQMSMYVTQAGHKSKTVRSSGYGKLPPQHALFTPNINRPRKLSCSSSKKPTSENLSSPTGLSRLGSEAVQCCSPPTTLLEKVSLCDTTGTTISLATSGDGKNLACSSASSVCILAFKKFDLDKSVNFSGHDGTINSLHFNLDSKWLVSSSKDGTAKVWEWKTNKNLLNINPASKQARCSVKSQKQLSRAGGNVLDARFTYMDQFLLVSSGNKLLLCSHSLHEPSCVPHKWRCVHTATVPAQYVTCVSAANHLHSYIVLAGCSNKSIIVHDLNAQRACVELRDVHVRPPHRLCQMGGSHAAVAMYDVFATAAVADGAKLWDLRSARCVARYDRHCSRSYATGLDLSACGTYLAAGSEDRAMYIYDTRKASDYVAKLSGLGDVVMAVAFNPRNSNLLAAASLSGYVAKYSA